MNRNVFLHAMNEGGDCYINYISPVSKKFKYHVGTINFSKDTSPYIYNKLMSRKLSKLPQSQEWVFCYDIDDFKPIELQHITSILALNKVVRQPLE